MATDNKTVVDNAFIKKFVSLLGIDSISGGLADPNNEGKFDIKEESKALVEKLVAHAKLLQEIEEEISKL